SRVFRMKHNSAAENGRGEGRDLTSLSADSIRSPSSKSSGRRFPAREVDLLSSVSERAHSNVSFSMTGDPDKADALDRLAVDQKKADLPCVMLFQAQGANWLSGNWSSSIADRNQATCARW